MGTSIDQKRASSHTPRSQTPDQNSTTPSRNQRSPSKGCLPYINKRRRRRIKSKRRTKQKPRTRQLRYQSLKSMAVLHVRPLPSKSRKKKESPLTILSKKTRKNASENR